MAQKYKFWFIIMMLGLHFGLSAQQTVQQEELRWNGIQTWWLTNSSREVLNFDNAHYPDGTMLPYVEKSFPLNGKQLTVEVEVEEALPVSAGEKRLLKQHDISATVAVATNNTISRGKKSLNVKILPFYKDGNNYYKVKSYKLKVSESPKAQQMAKKAQSYTQNSVLANGRFVKVRVKNTGVYKLTYEQLSNMGISPENVRIFGYGGVLLKEEFNYEKIDDLPELSIYMNKGADGVFNNGDYILFYAEGVNSWVFNPTNGMFEHRLNHYANYGYYFVTSDAGSGRRIAPRTPVTVPEGAMKADVHTFIDYVVHEKEMLNLIHSGAVFFGEKLNSNDPKETINFSVPNIVKDDMTAIRVHLALAASSKENSVFRVKLNGNRTHSMTISKRVEGSYNAARTALGYFVYSTNSDNLKFDIIFQSPLSTANAYLDYLALNVKRQLKMVGSEMRFRNVEYFDTDTYLKYQLANANANTEIWEITDPLNIGKVATDNVAGTLSFTDQTKTVREYLAIDPTNGDAFGTPEIVGAISNQNLHSYSAIDYVIITHPRFLAQAEELATFHRTESGLTVAVVTTEQVYNEFSSGTPDATAYRWFLKMLYDRAAENGRATEAPKYLLLFGTGTYDNRGILYNSGENLVLTYQAQNSLNKIASYVSDDYFGLLDDGEGGNLPKEHIDLGIGRFPTRTVAHANTMVNKTKAYLKNTQKGIWKNQLCFVADDGDAGLHVKQADSIAKTIGRNHRGYHINKVYLDTYKQEVTASGERYPLAKMKLENLLNAGQFLINYMGHAGPNGWTNELILTSSQIDQLDNDKLPIWVAATCDFLEFDKTNVSAGEKIVLNPNGGGVCLLSAARTVYATQNERLNRLFMNNLFQAERYQSKRLGDALRKAKNGVGEEINKLSYVLLGDPAICPNFPTKYGVITESLNGQPMDGTGEVKALSENTVKGYVVDINGNKMTDFSGELSIIVYDKEQTIKALDNQKELGKKVLTFRDRSNKIYSGKTIIENGEYTYTFMVPKDIRYNIANGRFSYYAYDTTNGREAQGYNENFLVGGTNPNYTVDDTPPQLELYLNSTNFVTGDKVNTSPLLIANITDDNAINSIGTGIGHDIRVVIDNNPLTSYILNDNFIFDTNSYTSGSVSFQIPTLSVGKHLLTFYAWDLQNNSTNKTIEFEVVEGLTPQIFAVNAYPNPAKETTRFKVIHDRPEMLLDVEVRVFDLTGRVLYYNHQKTTENVISWNLTGNKGGKLSPGTYIYQVSIETPNGTKSSKSNKIILLGQ